MPHIKKTVVMFLVSAMLGGGAWYLNSTGTLNQLSSSIFGSTFVCSEENLKDQAKEYRQTMIRQRKAIMYRDELETTIWALRDANKITEMKQQQKTLRTLIRGIGTYNRFIKSYSACQKKLSDMPITDVLDIVPVVNSAPVDGHDASLQTEGTIVSKPKVTSPSTDIIPSGDIKSPSITHDPVRTVPAVIVPDTTEPLTTREEIPETTQPPSDTDSAQA